MLREPDWQALADIQFLIYKRVADSLNAALSAVALSDIPGAGGQSPTYWRERATTKVSSVINLFTAWEYLLRYKMGETIPERAIRPFQVNTLLAWLSHQLQLSAVPVVEGDPVLHANQETLQEALLLLYSAAFTQGANVRLEMESQPRGMWFRIKFSRVKPLPPTFDDLLASFGDHWRARDAVFELSMARDFVRMNGSELLLHSTEHHGEFVFFIWRAGAKRGPLPSLEALIPALPGTGPLVPGASRAATQQSSVTQVISEGDLLGKTARPASKPISKPITSEVRPAPDTPVLKPPSVPEASEPTPPRPASARPSHFPLPPTVFGPDTRPPAPPREVTASAAQPSQPAPTPSPATPKSAVPSPAAPSPATPSPAAPSPATPKPAATTPAAPSPATPTSAVPKPPLPEPRLADTVAAPPPHTPELPEPGTVPPRVPMTEAGPVMAGPTPAPTPRLGEILSVQNAWKAESSETPSGDPVQTRPDSADANGPVGPKPDAAENNPGPVDPPGRAESGDPDPSAQSA